MKYVILWLFLLQLGVILLSKCDQSQAAEQVQEIEITHDSNTHDSNTKRRKRSRYKPLIDPKTGDILGRQRDPEGWFTVGVFLRPVEPNKTVITHPESEADNITEPNQILEPTLSPSPQSSLPSNYYTCSHEIIPFLKEATFSNSASEIEVHFSAWVDITSYGFSQFPCSSIFNSSGIFTEQCYWSSYSVVLIYLDFNSTLIPGDDIYIHENTIEAYQNEVECFSPVHSIQVSGPRDPPVPTGFLAGPQFSTNCSQYFTTTIQGLSGSCGRRFSRFEWKLLPLPHLAEEYLQAKSYSDIISIPTELLQVGNEYSIILDVENFLGVSASFSKNFSIVSAPLPNIYVDQDRITISRDESLTLQSQGSLSECESMNDPILEYSWRVEGYPQIQTQSKKPSVFLTYGYTFNSSQKYELIASVSQNGLTNSFVVTVLVEEVSPVAQIAGGSHSLACLNAIITLDASSSYDPNIDPNHETNFGMLSGIDYEWSCTGLSTNENCTDNVAEFGLNFDTLSFNTSRLGVGCFVISVKVTKHQKSSSAQLKLTVIDAPIPDIFIVPMNQRKIFSPEDEIVIYGKVTAEQLVTLNSTWTFLNKPLNSFDLDNYASTGTDLGMTFDHNTTTLFFHLVIQSNMLPTGAYTLQLLSSEGGPYTSAFSEVDVIINSPPTSGTVKVAPTVGVEWSTEFEVQNIYWIDDADDLPLVYSVAYRLGQNEFTAKHSSLESSQTISMLPSNPLSKEVVVIGYVCDQWGGKAQSSFSLFISKNGLDDIGKGQIVRSKFTECLDTNDFDCIYLMTGLLASTFGQINCTEASDSYCASLNRAACSEVDNTCGACLESFVGVSGVGNTLCLLPPPYCSNNVYNPGLETDVDCGGACTPCLEGQGCEEDSDCSFGLCDMASKTCSVPVKSCPGSPVQCNGVGVCEYYDVSSNSTMDQEVCVLSNLDCVPECICPAGYAGSACEYTEEQYADKVSNVETVLFGIQLIAEALDPSSDDLGDLSTLMRHTSAEVNLFGTEATVAAQGVLSFLSDTCLDSGGVDDEVFEDFVASLSNLQSVLGTTWNSTLPTTRRLLTESPTTDMLAGVTELWMMETIPGEEAKSLQTDSFSMVKYATYSKDLCGTELALPRDDMAIALGQSASLLKFGSDGCSNFLPGEFDIFITFMEIQPVDVSVFDEFKVSISVAPDYFASLDTSEVAAHLDADLEYQLLLQNNAQVEYMNKSEQFLMFDCASEDWTMHNIDCPSHDLGPISVECFGQAGIWNVSCTSAWTEPECVLKNASDPSASCEVIDYSGDATRCQCSTDAGLLVSEGLHAHVQVQMIENPPRMAYSFRSPQSFSDYDTYALNSRDWVAVAVLAAGTPFAFAFGVFIFYRRRKRKLIQPDTDTKEKPQDSPARRAKINRYRRFLSQDSRQQSSVKTVQVMPQGSLEDEVRGAEEVKKEASSRKRENQFFPDSSEDESPQVHTVLSDSELSDSSSWPLKSEENRNGTPTNRTLHGSKRRFAIHPSDRFQQTFGLRRKMAPDTRKVQVSPTPSGQDNTDSFSSIDFSHQEKEKSGKVMPSDVFQQITQNPMRQTSSNKTVPEEGGSSRSHRRNSELNDISTEMNQIRELKQQAQNELEILRRELAAERKAAKDAEQKMESYGNRPSEPILYSHGHPHSRNPEASHNFDTAVGQSHNIFSPVSGSPRAANFFSTPQFPANSGAPSFSQTPRSFTTQQGSVIWNSNHPSQVFTSNTRRTSAMNPAQRGLPPPGMTRQHRSSVQNLGNGVSQMTQMRLSSFNQPNLLQRAADRFGQHGMATRLAAAQRRSSEMGQPRSFMRPNPVTYSPRLQRPNNLPPNVSLTVNPVFSPLQSPDHQMQRQSYFPPDAKNDVPASFRRISGIQSVQNQPNLQASPHQGNKFVNNLPNQSPQGISSPHFPGNIAVAPPKEGRKNSEVEDDLSEEEIS